MAMAAEKLEALIAGASNSRLTSNYTELLKAYEKRDVEFQEIASTPLRMMEAEMDKRGLDVDRLMFQVLGR